LDYHATWLDRNGSSTNDAGDRARRVPEWFRGARSCRCPGGVPGCGTGVETGAADAALRRSAPA